MCFAYKSVANHIQQLEEKLKNMSKDISECDKSLVNFYHDVEAKKFNACEGYYIAKDLQRILLKRRKVKYEYNQIRALIEQLKKADTYLKKKENRFRKSIPFWDEVIHMEND
jgi:hypothetical protein